jgi:hypothetical protein
MYSLTSHIKHIKGSNTGRQLFSICNAKGVLFLNTILIEIYAEEDFHFIRLCLELIHWSIPDRTNCIRSLTLFYIFVAETPRTETVPFGF